MQLHQKINAWLNQPDDYATGLALLERVGIRGIVYRTLALGDDAYNRQRLETELRKWMMLSPDPHQGTVFTIDELREYVEKQTNVSVLDRDGRTIATRSTEQNSVPLGVSVDYGIEPPTLVVQAEMSKIPESDTSVDDEMSKNPSSVDTLKEAAYDLMNERTELKARIRAFAADATKQAERRDWAFRILAINDQIDELYSRIDFFEQYGYLPPTEEPPAEIDDTAALMNARSYVSRYRAKLKRPGLTAEQQDNYTKLLRQYEDEKVRLELKLKRA